MADGTQLDANTTSGDIIQTHDKPSVSAKVPSSLIDVGGSGDVESIIGDSGVTLPVGGLAAENAAVLGNPVLVGARYDASPRTLGDGDVGAIALDADGAVHISDGGNTITVDNGGTFAVQVDGTALTAVQTSANVAATDDAMVILGTATGYPMMGVATADTIDSGDVGIVAMTTARAMHVAVQGTVTVGSHAVTNAGTFAVQVDAALPAGTNAIGKLAANSGVDIGDVDVLSLPNVTIGTWSAGTLTVDLGANNDVSLNAGTNAIGKLAANSGVDIGDVDVTSISAGSNLIGDVSLQPRATGGLTMSKTTSAASTNATSLKASAGQVYSIQCFNVNAAVRYLKLYNKASAPTVGTDTPVKTLAIPGNTAGAGFVIPWPQGLAFGTGIAFALTTEATDAGTTGVAADEITVNIDYK